MKRRGLTLLELVVSLASSTILVAGLAGSLYISSQALPDPDDPARQSAQAATVVREIMSDVGLALSFTERTSRAITFTVPDRNSDNAPETIRYAWSGTAGDPLTYQYNGGSAVTIASNVQNFNLEALTRVMLAEALTAPVASNVVFEEFTKAKAASNVATIAVSKPAGTVEGSLLIAAVSLDGEARSSLAAPSGWTLIASGPAAAVTSPAAQTFGVWWKIATSSEPASSSFNWSGGRHAYAWVMRFSGHDVNTNATINAFAMDSLGSLGSLTPNSPAVTTTVPNAMILRLGGFDSCRFATLDSGTTPGNPGLSLHDPITVDRSSSSATSNCSGAAGKTTQSAAGNSGTATFVLTGTAEQYTTVTIAIAPAPAF